MKEGEDYYFNEEDLMVLTAKYLLRRGFCCGNECKCKHCPYYSNVPEPAKSKLILAREKESNKKNS
ncbi:MAG: DUF5522 domain-containing protein [Ferruginibacter sp.]